MYKKRIAIIFVIVLSVCTFLSLILYHSCYRSRNKDVLEKISQGDFTSIRGLDERQWEELNWVYERSQNTAQWIYADINKDGDLELIWQEKECISSDKVHRILAVFAVTPDGCRRVLWDVNDVSEFYFYHNNKIVYFTSYLGVYDYYLYGACEYNANWELEMRKTFEIYELYDMKEVEAADFLSRFDWAKDVDRSGCDEKAYYVMGTWITDKDFAKVLLQKEEWLELFRENIGTVNLEEKEY